MLSQTDVTVKIQPSISSSTFKINLAQLLHPRTDTKEDDTAISRKKETSITKE